MNRTQLLLSLAFLASPAALFAQAPPRFTIDAADSLHADVTLQSLEETGALHFGVAGARRTAPRWIELRQVERKLPALLTRSFLLLSNGDRIRLDPAAGARLEDTRLHVRPAASVPSWRAKGLDLFAPYAVLLFWSLPEGVDDADRFFTQLAEEPRKRDAVLLKNGDRIDGTLSALSVKGGCTIATERKKIDVPPSQLAGIAWNTDRQARLRAKKPFARAALEDGTRVNLVDLRFEEKSRQWFGKTQFGAAVEMPEASVLALDYRLGQAVDLAELTPTRYEQRPYLGVAWPLGRDAAADGLPLRLGGSTFEKGLGLHAPCQVAYALDGKFRRFDALVGIDELASPRGRAKIAIDIDGKRIDVNAGKELTSQAAPVPVRLDLDNAKTLTLIVEVGTFGDVQANVNFAKARLIKKE